MLLQLRCNCIYDNNHPLPVRIGEGTANVANNADVEYFYQINSSSSEREQPFGLGATSSEQTPLCLGFSLIKALPDTCEGSSHEGYRDNCDDSCAQCACSTDPLCSGYTLDPNPTFHRAKLMTRTSSISLNLVTTPTSAPTWGLPPVTGAEPPEIFHFKHFYCEDARGSCAQENLLLGSPGRYLSNSCDQSCARRRCSNIPSCTGYT